MGTKPALLKRKLFTILTIAILPLLISGCTKSENNSIQKEDTEQTSEMRFKENGPGVPGAVCVLKARHLPLDDSRCQGGLDYCCISDRTACCKWAVPSPDGEPEVGSIWDDPITFVEWTDTDTTFTMGAVISMDTSYIIEAETVDTIFAIDSMRVDSVWVWDGD